MMVFNQEIQHSNKPMPKRPYRLINAKDENKKRIMQCKLWFLHFIETELFAVALFIIHFDLGKRNVINSCYIRGFCTEKYLEPDI